MNELWLKSCPFCGYPKAKIVLLPADGKARFTDKYMVLCDYRDGGCGAASGWCSSPEEAAEVWNMRKRKWDGCRT